MAILEYVYVHRYYNTGIDQYCQYDSMSCTGGTGMMIYGDGFPQFPSSMEFRTKPGKMCILNEAGKMAGGQWWMDGAFGYTDIQVATQQHGMTCIIVRRDCMVPDTTCLTLLTPDT